MFCRRLVERSETQISKIVGINLETRHTRKIFINGKNGMCKFTFVAVSIVIMALAAELHASKC
jgi:hypothetical protein